MRNEDCPQSNTVLFDPFECHTRKIVMFIYQRSPECAQRRTKCFHNMTYLSISIRVDSPTLGRLYKFPKFHDIAGIMNAMASQIPGILIVYSTVCSGADQRKHQSSASLAFARGIHRWPVNSPHKGPVTRKMFSFDDVIMSKKQSTGHEGNAPQQNAITSAMTGA